LKTIGAESGAEGNVLEHRRAVGRRDGGRDALRFDGQRPRQPTAGGDPTAGIAVGPAVGSLRPMAAIGRILVARPANPIPADALGGVTVMRVVTARVTVSRCCAAAARLTVPTALPLVARRPAAPARMTFQAARMQAEQASKLARQRGEGEERSERPDQQATRHHRVILAAALLAPADPPPGHPVTCHGEPMSSRFSHSLMEERRANRKRAPANGESIDRSRTNARLVTIYQAR
jgi:hypothetical protein